MTSRGRDCYRAESSIALPFFLSRALRDQDRVTPCIETVLKPLDPCNISAVDL
jgi:hypothetical protein